jgi:hypothetical protein
LANLQNESKLDDMGTFEAYKNRVEDRVEIDAIEHMAHKGSQ